MPSSAEDASSDADNRTMARLKALAEGCWIGPGFSTAWDVYFQVLNVGGSLARDNKIYVGDLFYHTNANSRSPRLLQYVHDFGCWWVHTIEISVPEDEPDGDGGVAILTLGSGACPPEDMDGVTGFTETMAKLMNHPSNDESHDPARSEYEVENCHFEFDLGKYQESLPSHGPNGFDWIRHGPHWYATRGRRKGIRCHQVLCHLWGESGSPDLRGCHQIVFCGRDHQLQYWPQHKAAAAAAQSQPN